MEIYMERQSNIDDSDISADRPVVGHIRAKGHGSERMRCGSKPAGFAQKWVFHLGTWNSGRKQ
jgi:hypothetical protein